MPSIGPYTVHAIEAGRFGLDGGAMFGIVPKSLWASRIPPDAENRIPLHTRCLLLQSDDHTVLVDTGIGDLFDGTKYADLYAIDDTAPTLLESLAAHDVAPADVTDVILTHLHFDHCGGATRRDGEQRVPTFPNATYHVQADHWEWATTSNPKERGSFLQETFLPLDTNDQVHPVEGNGPVLPAIRVACVNGHTESQQVVIVADDTHTLAYVADLLPTSHHLAPAWTMAYDVRPLVTIEEKADFLRQAAGAGWTLFFEHDPDVVTARVEYIDGRVQVTDPSETLTL